MDPISAIILSGIFASLFARTVGNAVTDGIAQSKGKTPPSLEKWRKREAERVAAGEKPRSEPGPVGRWWHNAVEAHTAKAAQKHAARMELLRDNAPEFTAAHKEKLRKRAARWDKINRTVAGAGGAYWDVAKLAAEQAREALDERRERKTEDEAWKENERRSAEAEQDQADPATNPDQATGSGDGSGDTDSSTSSTGCIPEWDEHANYADTGERGVNPLTGNTYEVWRCQCGERTLDRFPNAKVLPFRRPDGDRAEDDRAEDGSWTNPNTELADTSATPDRLDSTINEGNPLVSTPNTTTEITDLDTALSYSQETAKYADTVSATLSDMLAQLTAAEQGLAAEAAAYEQAKASLQDEGFGSKVTGKFDAAAEALHAAADALKAAAEQVTAAAEQASAAGGEMRGAVAVFSDQLAVSETVGAAAQDAGVSKRTDFYAPA